ncbi:uncharacterized protein ACBT44_008530 [Syngnathus typhle]
MSGRHYKYRSLAVLPYPGKQACNNYKLRLATPKGDSSVKLLKYADDTTLIGLIRDGDESAYRQEVVRLVHWCSQNHLELNPLKTVEMTVDFWREPSPLSPLTIHSNTILSTDTFKFLGSTISRDLEWTSHIDCVRKKPQHRLYFLRQLRQLTCHRSCSRPSTLPSSSLSSAPPSLSGSAWPPKKTSTDCNGQSGLRKR